jgi:Na+/melibiose symporter-like transporter
LKTLYAAVPSLFNFIALFVAIAYPIDNQRHQEIRQAIKARKLGKPYQNPLQTAKTFTDEIPPSKGDI